jgi:hypothetical protein
MTPEMQASLAAFEAANQANMLPLEVSDVVFDAIKTNAVPEPFRKGIHGSLAAVTGSILSYILSYD